MTVSVSADHGGKHRHPDVISGAVLLVISVGYFLLAQGLPEGQDDPGPAFLPSILAIGLFGISVFLTVRGWKSEAVVAVRSTGYGEQQAWKTGLLLALTIIYLFVFPRVGALLSTWSYTFLVAVLFGARRVLQLVLVPTLSTAMIYLLFEWGLSARLP